MIDFNIIRRERKNQGISQTKLASDCFITQSYLSNIERGKVMPSLYVLEKIIRRLGKKCQFLLYDELIKNEQYE